jgi:arylsulfatase A-like enzyme
LISTDKLRRTACTVALFALTGIGCTDSTTETRPNVLWIVWDTVRADHMSLYGYDRPTTPHLDQWARRARVFDDVLSTATTTIPSHASMFTGQLPTRHGVDDGHPRLAPEQRTLAEILRDADYRTYAFSANPYLGVQTDLVQGFERVEHPWSPIFSAEAKRIVADKVAPYASAEWARHVKTAGGLARRGFEGWLRESAQDRPFLAVLNYMEAHLPLVPDRQYREAFLTEAQVEQSYRSPLLGAAVWQFTTGLTELDETRLAVLRGTYDAAIAELDHLLFELLGSLEQSGQLENTIVVLTSDHGELLGEHHMLNHQYSIHEPLLRVPLVISHPSLVEPGRDSEPAMNFDLFPTLLELTGTDGGHDGEAVSLFSDRRGRVRLSEYPFASRSHVGLLALSHPGFDSAPFLRSLRALRVGDAKYVRRSDGSEALFALDSDPNENRDLVPERGAQARALGDQLQGWVERLQAGAAARGQPVEFSEETRAMLESLGY